VEGNIPEFESEPERNDIHIEVQEMKEDLEA
jgi:hypothetical protein